MRISFSICSVLFALLLSAGLQGVKSADYQLIVLEDECSLCLKADSCGSNRKLGLADCDEDDSLQLWSFHDKYDYLIALKKTCNSDRYCIQYYDGGLFLKRCDEGKGKQEFTYDRGDRNTISPRRHGWRKLVSLGFGHRGSGGNGGYAIDDDDSNGRNKNYHDNDNSIGVGLGFGHRGSGDDDEDSNGRHYDEDDDSNGRHYDDDSNGRHYDDDSNGRHYDDDDDSSVGVALGFGHRDSGSSGDHDDEDDDSSGRHHRDDDDDDGDSSGGDDDDDDSGGDNGGLCMTYKGHPEDGSRVHLKNCDDLDDDEKEWILVDLDDYGSDDCKRYDDYDDDDSGGDDDDDDDSGGGDDDDDDYMMLVLKEDDTRCGCVGQARVGATITLCGCDRDDRLQHWDLKRTPSDQWWRLKNRNLCANPENDGKIRLAECIVNQNMLWAYDEYNDQYLCKWVSGGSQCASTGSLMSGDTGDSEDGGGGNNLRGDSTRWEYGDVPVGFSRARFGAHPPEGAGLSLAARSYAYAFELVEGREYRR